MLDLDQDKHWQAELLLNGFLEVTNLISWPNRIADSPADLPEPASLLFEEDSDEVDDFPANLAVIQEAADFLENHPAWIVRLHGHASTTGTDAANRDLSHRRAVAASMAIRSKGASKNQIDFAGFGETQLLDGVPPEDPAQRRVELEWISPFVLPRTDPADSLDHRRHTLRFLLHQHRLTTGQLQRAATGSAWLFGLAEGQASFIVVAEHMLADLAFTPGTPISRSSTRRLTAVQRLTLIDPETFGEVMDQVSNRKALTYLDSGLGRKYRLIDSGEAHIGWHNDEVRSMFAADFDHFSGLLVESSAPLWIRLDHDLDPIDPAIQLQFLPSGRQFAAPSGAEDFKAALKGSEAWQLCAFPFLGRLQPLSDDLVLAPTDSNLQVDPILALSRGQSDPRLLALTSRAGNEDCFLALPPFDLGIGAGFDRLDPAAREEALRRITLAGDPTVLETSPSAVAAVMDTLRSDGNGELGRPKALQVLFLRESDLDDSAGFQTFGESPVLVAQAVPQLLGATPAPEAALGFATFGARLAHLLPLGEISDERIAAAGVLSPRFPVADSGPVVYPAQANLIFPPYRQFSFELAEEGTAVTSAVFAEMLALPDVGHEFQSVARGAWHGADAQSGQLEEHLQTWTTRIRRQLFPESPAAVRRLRFVRTVGESDVTVSYRFELVAIPDEAGFVSRSRPLRTELEQLHFAEGQFGGPLLPAHPYGAPLRVFEVVASQIRGTLPVHLSESRETLGGSGLWLRVRNAANGVAGPPIEGDESEIRLWWSLHQMRVQFALPETAEPQLLPPNFRTRAVGHWLPAPSHVPLPEFEMARFLPADRAKSELPHGTASWQVALDSEYDFWTIGARAGAPLILRNHLLTQVESLEQGETAVRVNSGSTPVMHRFPPPGVVAGKRFCHVQAPG